MQATISAGASRIVIETAFCNAARAASGFVALGISTDDTIAILMRNCVEFVEASVAATLAGAFPVPINWHFKSSEVEHILEDSQAAIIVVHSDLLPDIEHSVPNHVKIILVEPSEALVEAYSLSVADIARTQYPIWNTWYSNYAPLDRKSNMARGSMIYTSGTTGKPKGVKRPPMTEKQLANVPNMLRAIYGIDSSDVRALVPGPLYHTAPNGFALSVLHAGGTLEIMPRFDAEAFLQTIEQRRISHVQMVPIMFVRLLQLDAEVRGKFDVSSLRCVSHTGAPCPPNIKRQMIDWWGPVISEFYGSTEGSVIAIINSEEWLQHSGSVGKAFPGVELQIRDEIGRCLSDGETGEIFFANRNFQSFSYHNQVAASGGGGDEFDSVGDLGHLEDGYLFLSDRRTDMIISGGVNVYTAEIEATLFEIEGVKDCAVFGVPDVEFGQAICAGIVLAGESDIDAKMIREYLRKRLAGYKLPRYIAFLNSLPRDDSGKVFKRELIRLHEEGGLFVE